MIPEDINAFYAVLAGIATILAVIASAFSAIGAAKSADVAVKAEARIAAAERASAAREIRRTAAAVRAHGKRALELFDDALRVQRQNATFHSTLGGSKTQSTERDLLARKAAVELWMNQLPNELPHEADHASEVQLALDELLMQVIVAKEFAAGRYEDFKAGNVRHEQSLQGRVLESHGIRTNPW